MIPLYKEKWFQVLVWSLAAFFFFLNCCVIIATLSPTPSEGQVHLWMAAMMKAMESSLMAYSMDLEEGGQLAVIVLASTQLVLPLAIGGMLAGLIIRFRKKS